MLKVITYAYVKYICFKLRVTVEKYITNKLQKKNPIRKYFTNHKDKRNKNIKRMSNRQ